MDKLTSEIKHGNLNTDEIRDRQEIIDEQFGRGIQKGIKKSRKIYAGEIPFSSVFHDLLKDKRLWLLVLKKNWANGYQIKPSVGFRNT